MRKVLFLAVLAAFPAAGCSSLGLGSPCASTGWNFTVGSPSTLTVPSTAVVQQSTGPLAALPLASSVGPAPALAALAATASPCATAAAPARPVLAALAQPECTLEDVCKKLDLIERRVSSLETYKTMPKGAP